MGGDGLPGPTDAWVTLGALARETSRIRLGTLVTAATFRLPGPLAIAVAQVDQMSGGRVELGLGTGWFEAEHTRLRHPFPPLGERFDRLEEQLAIITGLWETPEGETFSFAGTHYQLSGRTGPAQPAQRPRPPVILGGAGARRTPRLAARVCRRVQPSASGPGESAAQLRPRPRRLRRAGRDPASMRSPSPTRSSAARTRPSSPGGRRRSAGARRTCATRGIGGTSAQVVATSGEFAEPGRTPCISRYWT